MTPDGLALARPGWSQLTASAVRALLSILVIVLATVAGIGWLYVMRGLGWLNVGPRIPDSLPLLQLAGLDAQPLARLIVAWVPGGALAGGLLHRTPPPRRGLITLTVGLLLLLLTAQLSFALARNLRVDQVLWSHWPGLGPWLECLLLAAGSLVPMLWGPVRRRLGWRRG